MNRLDLQTPAPFGFLEVGHHGLPTRSYFICAYEADAYDGRQWVRTRYRHADDATRQRYRDQLRHTLLSLYAVGGYHRDTKLSNFMVREDGSHGDPLWMWIDLESVTFDCAIKPRHVIRNLVQLNSSIRNAWLTEADRLLFLREMAQHVPELLQPRVIKQMREWTLKRWR